MCIRTKNVNENKHRPNGASENIHRQYHIPLNFVSLPQTNCNINVRDMFQMNAGNKKRNRYYGSFFSLTEAKY